MKKFAKRALIALMILSAIWLTGCVQNTADEQEGRLSIVAITTMLADLSAVISKDAVSVKGLMGPGIDPHLYQASAGDVTLMQNADIVVYNGLHLEGKMASIFDSLTERGKSVICVGDGIEKAKLKIAEDEADIYDPHIWFDVALWKDAARILAKRLAQIDPVHEDVYKENLEVYLTELDELEAYILQRVAELEPNQRVLITAHDAFCYFGAAYGFEVRGLQGISTETEAGTADVSQLAEYIAEKKIKAIFIESSVPPKTIEALQAAVKARGFDVVVGGELYSDSLGGDGSGNESYINAFKANIDTIVDALK